MTPEGPGTDRLVLRQWRDADAAPFADLNADPAVVAHFPAPFSREQSDAAMARYRGKIDANGWGFWAVERVSDGAFLGMAGLNRPDYDLPFGPCTEIGWRLAREYWGAGYASEAARAALAYAFTALDCREVYAFTALSNRRSEAVMLRLGMRDTGRNFDHPRVPADSPVREHLLYHIDRDSWRAANEISG